MFTTQFKVTLGAIGGVFLIAAVAGNQVNVDREISDLQQQVNRLPVRVVVTPTMQPTVTASPTAVLKYKAVVSPTVSVKK